MEFRAGRVSAAVASKGLCRQGGHGLALSFERRWNWIREALATHTRDRFDAGYDRCCAASSMAGASGAGAAVIHPVASLARLPLSIPQCATGPA
jgi:hypothetical protein